MAKMKTEFDISATSEPVATKPKPKQKKSKSTKVEIECTVATDDFEGYCRERVWIRTLTQQQSRALRALTNGLRDSNSRYKSISSRTQDGFVVDKECDALRWLLDQIADQIS